MKRCMDEGSGSEKRGATLTPIQPGSGETVNHFGLLSLDFDQSRSKFTSYFGSRVSIERSPAPRQIENGGLGSVLLEDLLKKKIVKQNSFSSLCSNETNSFRPISFRKTVASQDSIRMRKLQSSHLEGGLLGGLLLIEFFLSVLPSSTQFGEIGPACPKFAIIVAIDLLQPYAKPESGANLVLI
jgi:hypothetical protein